MIGEGNAANVLWQCPECNGVYHTEQEASVISNGGAAGIGHKCKSRPNARNWLDPTRLPRL